MVSQTHPWSCPIAIVGMACRFPQSPSLDAFWHLLEAGRSAVLEGEPGSGIGRVGTLFPDPVERPACRFGAYLDELDQFDAAFFRISPVEAQLLDPQQRLMLETSWRAIEDAGMDPEGLRGTRTGVYAGISNNEYRGLILEVSDTAEPATSLYSVTGTSFNTAIGRVAYALGLEGPAMAVDTACSSSLVAIHQAVSGLQRGETDLALAGGVHTILSGKLLELRANAGMLSPDGRCATFDAAANGYVRGEGCGIVVLKRLAEAEADGDRIWGVVRGTALNQDGASPGLTVPSGSAQERVIAAALRQAGIAPTQVDYVEAHGTGTEVGDPIEIEATGTAYSPGREYHQPLLIGSVKTNIGHLESAAGVAGVIKVILSMNHGVIPRHLNFQTPNPRMNWDQLPLKVTAAPTPWPNAPDRPLRAGVSGFGWSGTNAHIILEGYGEPDGAPRAHWVAGPLHPVPTSLPASVGANTTITPRLAARTLRVLPLSGRTDDALREMARRYLSWLDAHAEELGADNTAGDALLADLAWTASVGRTHFMHRAGIVFDHLSPLRQALDALAQTGGRSGEARKTVFLFTGQGSQWIGMGRDLYEQEPVARAVLDRCESVFRAERGSSLLDVMFGRSNENLNDTIWAQPAIYALECAHTTLLESMGICPDILVGHSVGEFAAAHAAGVFGLEDGLRIMVRRSEILASLPEPGAMAAVFASLPHVQAAVRAHNEITGTERLSIAARNGAHQVISGPVEAVATVAQEFDSQAVRVHQLNTSQAFHSPLVEPVLDALEGIFDDINLAAPSRTLVSNVTGRLVAPGEVLDGAYWRSHARSAVAFDRAAQTLAELRVNLAVEVGPHAVLGPMLSFAWPGGDANGQDNAAAAPLVVATSHRPSEKRPEELFGAQTSFANTIAAIYEAGVNVAFSGLYAGEERRRLSIPGYPFQRERFWVEGRKQQRRSTGHPLLGERRVLASGEITFETEVFQSDPAWLADHRVFGRIIAPGALYGAMAVAISQSEKFGATVVEEMQLHNPLIFSGENESDQDAGRKVQALVLDAATEPARRVQLFSKSAQEDGWTLHAECQLPVGSRLPGPSASVVIEELKASLSPLDTPAFYRAKASVGISLGPPFRTLRAVWSRLGEALGEITLPEGIPQGGLPAHPLLLDGCFQVMGAARSPGSTEDDITYLPFGWERLWLTDQLPKRFFCHVRMKENSWSKLTASSADGAPEVFAGDCRLYDPNGALLGELDGFMVKRATRAALLSAVEGLDELLYEVVWRQASLAPGISPADFLQDPAVVETQTGTFAEYLDAAGVAAPSRIGLLTDLEWLSRSYALATLERLGWQRQKGAVVQTEALRRRLNIRKEHKRLFRRMLEMLAKSGVLQEKDGDFVVTVGQEDPIPDAMPTDIQQFAARMLAQYPHGSNEIGLFQRCGGALADVLIGREDPLALLFGGAEPTPADLYRKAPVARAANQLLQDTIAALLEARPPGRRLRVLEVGAGTGSATAAVLPELPSEAYDYVYTDISAGFFAEAEGRFGGLEASIDYRVLDIEKDPEDQGFPRHSYDLVIASNVLHATRYLEETLAHCRALLAPSGQLVALENLRGQGWLDLTFGQLDGWWRFADDYRPHHALASPAVWRRALADAGFGRVAVLGVDTSDTAEAPDRGVIVATGPAAVAEAPGVWVLAADRASVGAPLAAVLRARNQTVLLVIPQGSVTAHAEADKSLIVRTITDMESRQAWCSLLRSLPEDAPFAGVVHLMALNGHAAQATAIELGTDVKRVAASTLALAQGLTDADLAPDKGMWILTRGAQILEKEQTGVLAGATLWGLGKVLMREAIHLNPRLIDLDPARTHLPVGFADELLYPDRENHIAYRFDRRHAARLIRAGNNTERLTLPDEGDWQLEPDADGSLERVQVKPLLPMALGSRDVRVAVEATGLNFWDLFRAIGVIDVGLLGGEMCGRVTEIGREVTAIAPGDRVVGLAFGTFRSEVVTREEMVALAPTDMSATALATIPTAFTSAALSFNLSGLEAGERVLIHAGAGGVGLAAIQLAQAAGAEVFATASAPKQAYLRSLGVRHVFNSRTTEFGREIMDVTGDAGVHVVLNSLTGPGFIDASLSCLKDQGRFVEMARVDILSKEEMASVRPDVSYFILELDVLKEDFPEQPGDALRDVMALLADGQVTPMVHTRWALAKAGPAMMFMRAARHIGKIILAASPLEKGHLRTDRTYLVTGGLGGIGSALANWLAERGAGMIVLNGRRPPDPEVAESIASLQSRGLSVRVELADVTDFAAVDAMIGRIDRDLPPLGGVIHAVGVLSDASLSNQSWERFESVLWPKVLGAWHLHRSTVGRDLDLFVLFSSAAGVMGNPGQANHAAANAFLDQLAAHRRAMGLPGQAIAWGAWSGIGEAEEQRERIEERFAARGVRWITPQQGFKVFEWLMRQDMVTGVVTAVDWPVFQQSVERPLSLLDELLSEVPDAEAAQPALSDELIARLSETPMADREGLMVSFLQQELQAVLRLTNPPAPSVGFFDLGMDSLMAVELRNRLNRALAGEYVAPNTVVFDYPDIASLSRHLIDALGKGDAAPSRAVPPSQPPVQEHDGNHIAVVGMACRFPGAPDLATFWSLLAAGGNAVTNGRPDPGPWQGVAGNPSAEDPALRQGGFVEGLDQFDARFFGIRPIEARMMDPRQRMLLETSWQALEDAGINPDLLVGSRAGVYAGLGSSEYRDLIPPADRENGYLGTAGSVAIGRIAFALGLMGPAVPVDMSCASSLAAVHQAAAALRQGEVDLALAGGVHAVLSPEITRFMAEFGMLSPSGCCKTFDASADGFVRGEGCGMVVLKRLRDAEADGDRIWGLIRGSAINQNGASAALTVPKGTAQEEVLADALARAGVPPADVDYLEVHATGSQLGDPIEVHASAAVYGAGRDATRPLLLGTVKTNIGHLESAAGMAGLIKVLLAMHQGQIPKNLHFVEPNPHMDWEQLPVRVVSESMAWPRVSGRPPRAGVSAFALSGTNAHLVVEGYDGSEDSAPAEAVCRTATGASKRVGVKLPDSVSDFVSESGMPQAVRPRQVRLLPLSAKSSGALCDLARSYLSWLGEYGAALNSDSPGAPAMLADLSWTAGIGRCHFLHRAGIVFDNAASLQKQLRVLASVHNRPAAGPKAVKVAFAYSSAHDASVGLGASLYEREPVVRAVLDHCNEKLRTDHGISLLDEMFGPGGGPMNPTWLGPAAFALQSALTALWSSIGVRPGVVVGAAIGELAAAHAAGVFTLDEGLRLAVHQSALTQDSHAARSGAPTEHTLQSLLADLSCSQPTVPLISGTTGQAVESKQVLDADYWLQRAGRSSMPRECARTLAQANVEIVIDIGPWTSLGAKVVATWPDSLQPGRQGANAPVLLKSPMHTATDGNRAFVEAVARAYEAGMAIDFAGMFSAEERRRISLPGYPFQREKFWVESSPKVDH